MVYVGHVHREPLAARISQVENFQEKGLFYSQFVSENVRNSTKTVLVILIALNTRNLSKIVML